MTTTQTGLVTADELLRLSARGFRGELVRGVLRETMATNRDHGIIVINLGTELRNFVKPRQLGTLVGSDSGVLIERDPDTVREPDIAYTSFERLARGTDRSGYAEAVPNLVVEVASPNDRRDYPAERAQMWLSFGVELVWFVFPETRSIDVYRADQPVVTVSGDGPLDGLDVLPGFSCPLTDIFDE